MPKCLDSPWYMIVICLSGIFVVGFIIMGSIVTAQYVRDKHDETVLKSTLCYVTNTYIDSYPSTDENGYTTYHSYTVFLVRYNTSDGQEINSKISSGSPDDYKIGKAYQCYYDSTKFETVRWDWPTPRTYLILLCIAWALLGVILIVWIILTIVVYCSCKKCCPCVH